MKTIRAQASESALRLLCTTWSTWSYRKRLHLTQSSILMWRFLCSCRRSFLNSRRSPLLRLHNKSRLCPSSLYKIKAKWFGISLVFYVTNTTLHDCFGDISLRPAPGLLKLWPPKTLKAVFVRLSLNAWQVEIVFEWFFGALVKAYIGQWTW